MRTSREVQRGRVHAQAHVAGPDLGLGPVLEHHHLLGLAELVDP
jgi:hypothetical protein